MESVEIRKENVHSLFFKNTGMPKKEALYTAIDIAKKLKIDIDNLDGAERHYCLNLINSTIFAEYRKQCRDSNILWVDCRVPDERYVYHGFTHNTDLIEDSLMRMKKRGKSAAIEYNNAKRILESSGYCLLPDGSITKS